MQVVKIRGWWLSGSGKREYKALRKKHQGGQLGHSEEGAEWAKEVQGLVGKGHFRDLPLKLSKMSVFGTFSYEVAGVE